MMTPRIETLAEGVVTLYPGDCLDVLKTFDACSVDACVCDPPYGLSFMGKAWDRGVPGVEYWEAVYRVLKPGAHLLAFGGTRTFGRMHVAIEDAGFEVRDMCLYLYGSGFPKSLNVGKSAGDAICSCEALSERDVRPVRNADVSASVNSGDQRREILLAGLPEQDSHRAMPRSKPEKGRSGATESGMEGRGDLSPSSRQLRSSEIRSLPGGTDFDGEGGRLRDGASAGDGALDLPTTDPGGMRPSRGSSAIEQCADESRTLAMQPQPQKRGAWDHCGRCGKPILPEGLGTALKPACEPIVLARKPPSESTVAANVLKWGTGALNIDGCRVATDESLNGGAYAEVGGRAVSQSLHDQTGMNIAGKTAGKDFVQPPGRWPANVIHDGSDEVVGAFPQTVSGDNRGFGGGSRPGGFADVGANGKSSREPVGQLYSDAGSASRFFYTAKADADDRLGSKHPTVKPLDLMQYLVRLVTPPKGLCLDPFAGTGTTGEACIREGFRAILIEREAEYQDDIRRRMKLAMAGPDERSRESIKAKMKDKPEDHGPLFGGSEMSRGGADKYTDTSQIRTDDRTNGTEMVRSDLEPKPAKQEVML